MRLMSLEYRADTPGPSKGNTSSLSSLNQVGLLMSLTSVSEFWVQIHGLPMDRQHKSAVTQIGGMIGPMLDAGRPRGLGCPSLSRF
jgi:hypothetical protein